MFSGCLYFVYSNIIQTISLAPVTAGDFAVLIKQARIMPFANSEAMLKALQAECAMKEGAKGTMGFF